MRVHADKERCISSGQCVMAAPEVFDQRQDDGVVQLKTDAPPSELGEDVHQAAAMCPAQAITVIEA